MERKTAANTTTTAKWRPHAPDGIPTAPKASNLQLWLVAISLIVVSMSKLAISSLSGQTKLYVNCMFS